MATSNAAPTVKVVIGTGRSATRFWMDGNVKTVYSQLAGAFKIHTKRQTKAVLLRAVKTALKNIPAAVESQEAVAA